MRIICAVLGIKDDHTYKQEEIIFSSGKVTCHLINCEKNDEYDTFKFPNGTYKPSKFLESIHKGYNIQMFSGSDRKN